MEEEKRIYASKKAYAKLPHRDKARALFLEGYNCAQSVFGAFAEDYGIDREMGFRLAASFGGGMGRMREICGAFSGVLLVAGLETGCVVGRNADGKAANYKEVQELASIFRERCGGSIICRELLGIEKAEGTWVPAKRTQEYYKKRPCPQIIETACDILDERYFQEAGTEGGREE